MSSNDCILIEYSSNEYKGYDISHIDIDDSSVYGKVLHTTNALAALMKAHELQEEVNPEYGIVLKDT